MTETLLEVNDLNVAFRLASANLTVSSDVSFSVDRGKVLGLIGESGSGKTVTSKAILRLLPKNASLLGPCKGQIVHSAPKVKDRYENLRPIYESIGVGELEDVTFNGDCLYFNELFGKMSCSSTFPCYAERPCPMAHGRTVPACCSAYFEGYRLEFAFKFMPGLNFEGCNG